MFDRSINADAPPYKILQRSDWIDTAKGLAILLVVFGHAWRGVNEAGLIPPALFHAVDSRIYAFHMPVFFALSGLLVAGSLWRATPRSFTVSRVSRLIWPMVVWTYIFLGVKLAAGSVANQPITFTDMLVLPIPGHLHLWFLWALYVLQMALLLTRPMMSSGRYSTVGLLGLAVGAIALALWPLPDIFYRLIGPALLNAPYFVLGIVLSQTLDLSTLNRTRRMGALAVFLLVVVAYPFLPQSPVILLGGSLVLTLCFLTVCAGLSQDIGPQLSTWLTRLGIASMAIYLAHTIFSAAMREVLFAIGVTSLSWHVAIGFGIGILGPLILLWCAQKIGAVRLLGFK
ncbi:acyltransferase (plasmid) [Pseudorhodobacter turbinis]|uniref:Acyltransferase n=1 Tax=Pseudorhodobacter turbinis TaxID=2500533 RepID=A0A4P8EIC1_9RHOB|nr:acyltransferase [Pseudorhodobacter turbinis]QCO56669.1 acyltransferase [Pseudorhodobacter turbinis]